MTRIRTALTSVRTRLAVLTAICFGAIVAPTFAAADATTGIDWAQQGTSVLDAARPAILAGLAIMVVLLAVQLGRKFFSKVAK